MQCTDGGLYPLELYLQVRNPLELQGYQWIAARVLGPELPKKCLVDLVLVCVNGGARCGTVLGRVLTRPCLARGRSRTGWPGTRSAGGYARSLGRVLARVTGIL